jgi:hypothetical protein
MEGNGVIGASPHTRLKQVLSLGIVKFNIVNKVNGYCRSLLKNFESGLPWLNGRNENAIRLSKDIGYESAFIEKSE